MQRASLCAGLLLLLGLSGGAPASLQEDEGELAILVLNDDGIDTEGLRALVLALDALGDVYVCAPEGERSGSSQSVAWYEPMSVWERSVPGAVEAVAIGGKPADCVSFAFTELRGGAGFDLIVSGINHGQNVGELSHLSGTVGGAMEGAWRGVPTIAVSQDSRDLGFDLATAFVTDFAGELLQRGGWPGVVWSINVPVSDVADAQGVAPSPMGGSFMFVQDWVRMSNEQAEDGSYPYRVRMAYAQSAPPGTDTEAYYDKKISVTPLRFDWTDHDALSDALTWGLELP